MYTVYNVLLIIIMRQKLYTHLEFIYAHLSDVSNIII